MSNESNSHLALVNELAAYCAEQELTVFEHQYSYLSFGSWVLVVGRPHKRVRLSWDGREYEFTAEYSKFESQSSRPNWSRLKDKRAVSGRPMSHEEQLDQIKSVLEERFAENQS